MHQAALSPSRPPWRLKGAHPKSAKPKGSETLSSKRPFLQEEQPQIRAGKRDRLTDWVPNLIRVTLHNSRLIRVGRD